MDYKQLILDSGRRMATQSLTVSTWGNISARDPETNYIYVTPSGMEYDTCTKDDIVVYDIEGNHIEGARKPTIELWMHIRVFQKRSDVNAMIHTHPLYSTVLGALKMEIPAITEEFAQVLGHKVIPARYELPGTMELADSVVEGLGADRAATLLINHGAVCVAEDMEKAFKVSAVLEKAAQIYYMAKTIGQPNIVSPEHVDMMHAFFNNEYGQR
ncbi:MAG: class II aldolase/adducin family protein [Christensenellaceae bacterium]|jgi:L-fuculose-phosphate aldolase